MSTRQEGPRGFEIVDSDAERERPARGDADASSAPPGFGFASFVLSLSTSALIHLGVVPEEAQQGAAAPEVNLPMARQVIDILEMLAQKTKGNLDDEESRLLSQVLHDLHMRYVEAARG